MSQPDPKPTMTAEMQEFLAKFAAAIGKPAQFRVALETLIQGLMISPVELTRVLRRLADAGHVSDIDSILAEMRDYVGDGSAQLTDATSDSAPAASPTKAATTSASKPPKTVAKATRPASTGDADLPDLKPVSFAVNGTSASVTNWRGVYIGLTEAALDAGKEDAIPTSWFRDTPAENRKTETQIKGGKWLYTNLPKSDQITRARVLAGILGVAVSVKVADGSSEREVSLS